MFVTMGIASCIMAPAVSLTPMIIVAPKRNSARNCNTAKKESAFALKVFIIIIIKISTVIAKMIR